jgi:hypothetical protein
MHVLWHSLHHLSQVEYKSDESVENKAANINTSVLTNNRTTSNNTLHTLMGGSEGIITDTNINGECCWQCASYVLM